MATATRARETPASRATRAVGAKLRDQWTPEGIIGETRTDLAATARTLRAQLAPHAATATVAGLGVAAQATVAAGASPAGVAAFTALVSLPTAAAAVMRVRKRAPAWMWRAALGAATAAGWLVLAPLGGVGAEDLAVLVAAEYGLAARWWQTHRIHHTPAPDVEATDPADVDAEPEPEPLSPAEQIMADWDTYVAGKNRALPGSRLTNPKKTRHGWSFDLDLERGAQTLAAAVAQLPHLASGLSSGGDDGGLDIGADDLVIESHPTAKAAWKCRLQVITDSPIAGDVNFTGPRRRGGLLELGPFADGAGEATYRLYTPGSMWSGIIIGGTGAGKSRLIENIVISAMSGADTVTWFIDPQGGTSSPALAEHADWFGSTEGDTDAMLDAALKILEMRGAENNVEGLTEFTPSPERPGLLIVVDECHGPFPARAGDWAKLAREGRKVGIALLGASQYPGLLTFGQEPLRASVMMGNAIVLYSASRQAGGLMAGLQVDPMTLPRTPGYAYVQGGAEGGRTAPFRNRNTAAPGGPGPARWMAVQPKAQLDTLSATATLLAGTAYQDRHTSTDFGREAARARVEALRAGRLPAGMGAGASPARAKAAARWGDMEVLEPLNLFAATAVAEDAEPVDVDEALAQFGDSHHVVYAAVLAGRTSPAALMDHTDLSRRRVHDILDDLLGAGVLRRARHGHYAKAA